MRWVSRSLTGCAHGRQHHPPRHDGGAPRRCGDRIRTCGARRTNHSLTRRFVPIHPPTYPKWGLSGMVVTGVPVAGPGSGSVRSSNPCVGHCCRTMRVGQAVARSASAAEAMAGPHFRAPHVLEADGKTPVATRRRPIPALSLSGRVRGAERWIGRPVSASELEQPSVGVVPRDQRRGKRHRRGRRRAHS